LRREGDAGGTGAVLAPVCARFTEGYTTADLAAAERLLEQLGRIPAAAAGAEWGGKGQEGSAAWRRRLRRRGFTPIHSGRRPQFTALHSRLRPRGRMMETGRYHL
jgi:hypothetical protein